MNRGEFLEKTIKEKGFTIMSLSKESGVAYTTIRSMIERNLKNASIDNVLKVCKVLGIKADDLSKEEYKTNEVNESTADDPLPKLSPKDEHQIAKDLERMLNELESNEGQAALEDGEIDQESKELLRMSLEQSMRIAKQIAKQKFTPKKYKK